jgi:hypothetical protein
MPHRLLLLIAVLAVSGCQGTGPLVPTVALGSTFELAPGEAVRVDHGRARIRFLQVTGDHRCPADAICILGGDAVVHIEVYSARERRQYELHTGDMRPVRHGELTIELVQLQPYPFSSRAIEPGDYRATLRVTA